MYRLTTTVLPEARPCLGFSNVVARKTARLVISSHGDVCTLPVRELIRETHRRNSESELPTGDRLRWDE